VAFLIYNEGIETVIVMASIFGADVLGMETGEIILFFLMIQAIAFFGSLIFGYLADAIGNNKDGDDLTGGLVPYCPMGFPVGDYMGSKDRILDIGGSGRIGDGWESDRLPLPSRNLYS
jgi:MFS-type transporter involved in bile tolerance (Atg22 family)